MTALAKRITDLRESATIKMAQLSRELKQQGKDIIDLSLGEPDFDTPEHIRESAKKAIDDGFSHYTAVNGIVELREAVCHKFKRDNNLDYEPDQIVVSTGAKQSLANLMLCLVNPGDEVILPCPYWVSYQSMVEIAQGTVVTIPTTVESRFKITAEQLEDTITSKSKILVINSPCNPTGSVYHKEELEAIANVVARHDDLYIISDEIYEYINFSEQHQSMGQFDIVKDRVITVNGLSKGFAMTGWRLGYIGAPKEIAAACTKMQGQFTSATNSITQKAAITALTGELGPSLKMKAAFDRRRQAVLELLADIPGFKTAIPDGAFYMFPDVSSYFGKHFKDKTIKTADDLCMYLLYEANVSIVTGNAFGAPNCVRFSYATSEKKIREAMVRMKNALELLA